MSVNNSNDTAAIRKLAGTYPYDDIEDKDSDINALKEKLMGILTSLSTKDKEVMKGKLKEKGLPISFKNVTNIDVIKSALEVVSEE